MGASLRRSAHSPNIKERRDYSCALFDVKGRVIAMGDHMPVHLGAMPKSVEAALAELGRLEPGDVAILNDPFRGGTHLPDITAIAPVYVSGAADVPADRGVPGSHLSDGEAGGQGDGERRAGQVPRTAEAPRTGPGLRSQPTPASSSPQISPSPSRPGGGGAVEARGSGSGRVEEEAGREAGVLLGYVAARAHHADVGGMAAGSMPLAREIYQEGLRIPPVLLMRGGERNEAVWRMVLANVRTPEEREGDLAAQIAALVTGQRRLLELVGRRGAEQVRGAMSALLAYADRLVRAGIQQIPDGEYEAEDWMDDDGVGDDPLPIRVRVTVSGDALDVDFEGTAPQTAGGINAVSAITISATRYVVRVLVESLLAQALPAGGGAMSALTVRLPERSLVAAGPPASVAGGNVETSQRITDVLFRAFAGALPDRVPAQSQGTMNNLTVGGIDPRTGEPFAYYETAAGGMGGGPQGPGLSGVHVNMTNSLNTPIEALEHAYPFRVRAYALRAGSGGAGRHPGGDGLRRDVQLLGDAEVSLLTERRHFPPRGLAGGEDGARGENVLIRDGAEQALPSKTTFFARAGDVISV
ncbi:MAG: hydantoinase B/oxoprolinase family protein, partial [Gemmatimonadota bacterium]